jgi:hypothetical protein
LRVTADKKQIGKLHHSNLLYCHFPRPHCRSAWCLPRSLDTVQHAFHDERSHSGARKSADLHSWLFGNRIGLCPNSVHSRYLTVQGSFQISLELTEIGVIVFACGVGFPSAARSLITSLVHPDEVSRLYAFLAVIETVGSLIYGPVLSRAFGWGMDLGGLWSGMAFFICAILFAVVGLPIWLVREPTPEMDIHG